MSTNLIGFIVKPD